MPRAGVGKPFTRRARFGKTVEAAGRTLIGKLGEDFFFRDYGPRTNVISKMKGFHPVFDFNFASLRLLLLKITAIHDLSRKKRSSAQFTVGVYVRVSAGGPE